jgi:hypothetical protein
MDTVDDMALHKAAFEGDVEKLKELLDAGSDINAFDKHGNTPLILALHFKKNGIVQELLARGADSGLKTKAGWSPSRYAVASADVANIRAIHRANINRERINLLQRLPSMIASLKSLPDFYTELKWEFSSWVPFVTRFCPSDTYKIWKKGANFRVDTTLVGYDNLKWIRGKLSIIFRETPEGSEHPGEVLIVDYVHERYENATEVQLGTNTDIDEQVERELQELYGMPLMTTQAATSGCRFEPMLNWRGSQKEETVSGYKCKLLAMDGFVYRALQRHLKDAPPPQPGQPIDHSVGDDLNMSWERYARAQASPTGKVPLLYKNEFVTGKERVFKGSVWMTSQFARQASDFLPIFECMLLSNQPKRFEKLAEFVRLKLPEDGFPVKVELPVFPTISGQASFLIYQEKTPSEIDDQLFQIPESFAKGQKVQVNAKAKKEKKK